MNGEGRRVVLGMSGGVDSSVAAWLLQRDGWDVVGVTMKVWPQDCLSRAEDKCCGPSAIADARGVAHRLGIPHYVVDESENFEKTVIGYFADEYRAGRTPNPCVMCNEHLKFGSLRTKASALGAEFIATGHYAIIGRDGSRATLHRGSDPRKDQSYFLFSLSQDQLLHALMPLGRMSKPEIRDIARSLGLKVAEKADSQEICFVPGNDYKAFLRGHLGEEEFQRGGIYGTGGEFLGGHEGIEMFTIGQRKGLPGGSQKPRYVVDIDPDSARVTVGGEEDLVREEFDVDRVTWHGAPPAGALRASVKIRSTHAGAMASIMPLPGLRARVVPDVPQRAITPGQAAVFYNGDQVVGGGWIVRQPAPLPA